MEVLMGAVPPQGYVCSDRDIQADTNRHI